MSGLLVVAFGVVALAGTAVVLIAEPLRQTLALGLYGFALTALFFSLQAPDVALSELVVSGLAMPLIILAALRKLAEQEKDVRDRDGGEQ